MDEGLAAGETAELQLDFTADEYEAGSTAVITVPLNKDYQLLTDQQGPVEGFEAGMDIPPGWGIYDFNEHEGGGPFQTTERLRFAAKYL